MVLEEEISEQYLRKKKTLLYQLDGNLVLVEANTKSIVINKI